MPQKVQEQAHCVIGQDYPLPIVDEKVTAKQAKDMIGAVSRELHTKAEAQQVYERHGSRRGPRGGRGPSRAKRAAPPAAGGESAAGGGSSSSKVPLSPPGSWKPLTGLWRREKAAGARRGMRSLPEAPSGSARLRALPFDPRSRVPMAVYGRAPPARSTTHAAPPSANCALQGSLREGPRQLSPT